jgi:hypothetical protein
VNAGISSAEMSTSTLLEELVSTVNALLKLLSPCEETVCCVEALGGHQQRDAAPSDKRKREMGGAWCVWRMDEGAPLDIWASH